LKLSTIEAPAARVAAPTVQANKQRLTVNPHLTATLILACLAQFMVILDVSVVNVALPAIRHSLGFSEDGLQWVVNAYTVTFAGFLLLGGRAADLLGRRSVFVWGLVLFALASLAAGFAQSQTVLIVARLIQGLGGAVIAPASLSILTTTFTKPKERNRAIGIWGAMGGAGGAAGVLLGGVLTEVNWRWIFFINVPIGLVVAVLAFRLITEGRSPRATRNFDLTGALSATIGLSLLVYGIVRTDTTGWGNGATLGLIAGGIALLLAFLVNEGRFAKAPLMPLGLFKSRALSAANLVVLAVGASTFGMWFFFSLYLQEIKDYSPLHAGLIFLPMTIAIVIGSTIASRITLRVGAKRLLIFGMVLLVIGLALFSRLTVGGSYLGTMLAPGLLTSFGMPFAFIPGTITATSGVDPHEAGLASGVVNSSRLLGGALGLAILATIATSRSNSLLHDGLHHTVNYALTSGFQVAFLLGAVLALVGLLVAIFFTPNARTAIATRPQVAVEV
jgi:EmrB/QacA subfamily drug resistance transporter